MTASFDALSDEEVIKAGSKSFAAASRLFDAKTRSDVWRLYAWCRFCDDVVDGQVLGYRTGEEAAGQERLDELKALTRMAIATDAPVPRVFEGLRQVARRHAIPPAYPLALIDGFAMDVAQRRHDTLEDTALYSYHVAGVVGVMMAMAMGVRDQPTLHRACDLGIAFQLTNIARDVVEDAEAERIYLPAEWLREAGIEPSPREVASPRNRAAVVAAAERLLCEADGYYRSARVGIGRLPLRSAWAIAAARDVYRDIGRIVRRRGEAAWDSRASASTARKIALLGRGALVALATRLPVPETPRDGLWTMPSADG